MNDDEAAKKLSNTADTSPVERFVIERMVELELLRKKGQHL